MARQTQKGSNRVEVTTNADKGSGCPSPRNVHLMRHKDMQRNTERIRFTGQDFNKTPNPIIKMERRDENDGTLSSSYLQSRR